MSPVISVEELRNLMHSPDVYIVDVSNGKSSRENYGISHLFGADFIDLNTELSEIRNPEDGRHPLPSLARFREVLENHGIQNSTHVICYDDKAGANAAARFWWMLRAVGHRKVQVLNGGLQEARKYRLELSEEIFEREKTNYDIPSEWSFPVINMEEVEANLVTSEYAVIDVRENVRYRGLSEPIDTVAGHIPSAVNKPFQGNLTGDSLFRTPEEIRVYYGDIDTARAIIHCGSGVTACHSILAMDYAGLSLPILYVGSWSQWSVAGKPIEVSL